MQIRLFILIELLALMAGIPVWSQANPSQQEASNLQQLRSSVALAEAYEKSNQLDSMAFATRQAMKSISACTDSLCVAEGLEVINSFGFAAGDKGQYSLAITSYQWMLDTIPFEYSHTIKILLFLSTSFNESGDYDQALSVLAETLKLCREKKDLRNESLALDRLSNTYSYLGDIEKSIELSKEGLIISQSTGHKDQEYYLLFSIGSTFMDIQQLDSAQHYLNYCWHKPMQKKT